MLNSKHIHTWIGSIILLSVYLKKSEKFFKPYYTVIKYYYRNEIKFVKYENIDRWNTTVTRKKRLSVLEQKYKKKVFIN